jgi:hypothetical protein
VFTDGTGRFQHKIYWNRDLKNVPLWTNVTKTMLEAVILLSCYRKLKSVA